MADYFNGLCVQMIFRPEKFIVHAKSCMSDKILFFTNFFTPYKRQSVCLIITAALLNNLRRG